MYRQKRCKVRVFRCVTALFVVIDFSNDICQSIFFWSLPLKAAIAVGNKFYWCSVLFAFLCHWYFALVFFSAAILALGPMIWYDNYMTFHMINGKKYEKKVLIIQRHGKRRRTRGGWRRGGEEKEVGSGKYQLAFR